MCTINSKLISDNNNKNDKNGNNKAPTTTNDKNNDYITTEVTDNKIACAFLRNNSISGTSWINISW